KGGAAFIGVYFGRGDDQQVRDIRIAGIKARGRYTAQHALLRKVADDAGCGFGQLQRELIEVGRGEHLDAWQFGKRVGEVACGLVVEFRQAPEALLAQKRHVDREGETHEAGV